MGAGQLFIRTAEVTLDYESAALTVDLDVLAQDANTPELAAVDSAAVLLHDSPAECEVLGVSDVAVGLVAGTSEAELSAHEVEAVAISADILAGRRMMLDDRLADMGQNGTPNTWSAARKQSHADNGWSYFDASRSLTDPGQGVISELVALNPDFQYGIRVDFQHVPDVAVNGAGQRPWDFFRYNLATSKRAKDTAAGFVRAWPDPAQGAATAYWADVMDEVAVGYTYDRAFLVAWMQGLVDLIMACPNVPVLIKLDYYNPHASGPFTWPGENPVDFDQDGTAYASDAAEQQAFADFQLAAADVLRGLLPYPCIVTGNGKAAWSGVEPSVEATIDGLYLEEFPTTPWFGPAEAFSRVFSAWTSNAYRKPSSAKLLAMVANSPTNVGANSDASRCAALLFDLWFRNFIQDSGGTYQQSRADDATWLSWLASLGAPTGSPTQQDLGGGTTRYERVFVGGTVRVDVSTTNGVLSAGVI